MFTKQIYHYIIHVVDTYEKTSVFLNNILSEMYMSVISRSACLH